MITSEAEARAFCAERINQAGLARLDTLAALLTEENVRQNLVSTTSLATIWQRHFADSLQLVDYVPRGTSRALDLGSGAGFPGIVLALAREDLDFVLVESRKRRADWLKRATEALDLANCRVEGAQLETLENIPTGLITARAFAPLGKLLRLSARFSTRDTVWLLPKGRSAAQELSEQPIAIQTMFHVEQSLTDPGGGILVGKGTPQLP